MRTLTDILDRELPVPHRDACCMCPRCTGREPGPLDAWGPHGAPTEDDRLILYDILNDWRRE